jgi:hypothetical protein
MTVSDADHSERRPETRLAASSLSRCPLCVQTTANLVACHGPVACKRLHPRSHAEFSSQFSVRLLFVWSRPRIPAWRNLRTVSATVRKHGSPAHPLNEVMTQFFLFLLAWAERHLRRVS